MIRLAHQPAQDKLGKFDVTDKRINPSIRHDQCKYFDGAKQRKNLLKFLIPFGIRATVGRFRMLKIIRVRTKKSQSCFKIQLSPLCCCGIFQTLRIATLTFISQETLGRHSLYSFALGYKYLAPTALYVFPYS